MNKEKNFSFEWRRDYLIHKLNVRVSGIDAIKSKIFLYK